MHTKYKAEKTAIESLVKTMKPRQRAKKDRIRLKKRPAFAILGARNAGLVYRYYAAFPRLRGGFDSRIPLQKKAHICLPRQCVLFSTKFALAGKWNSFAVKYLLCKYEIFASRMWANFISHCDEVAIFHNDHGSLFHIRRIFHFNFSNDYDII